MTQKTTTKPSAIAKSKIVVFGADDNCKPHAASFSTTQAAAARSAAKSFRLNIVEAPNEAASSLIAKLPEARVHAAGPGLIPAISEDLYESLVAVLNPRGEAIPDRDKPITKELPATWDAVKPGHLVLAQQSLVEGWWEAIVVERTADNLKIRWRDYPALPPVTTALTKVALLNKGSS